MCDLIIQFKSLIKTEYLAEYTSLHMFVFVKIVHKYWLRIWTRQGESRKGLGKGGAKRHCQGSYVYRVLFTKTLEEKSSYF